MRTRKEKENFATGQQHQCPTWLPHRWEDKEESINFIGFSQNFG